MTSGVRGRDTVLITVWLSEMSALSLLLDLLMISSWSASLKVALMSAMIQSTVLASQLCRAMMATYLQSPPWPSEKAMRKITQSLLSRYRTNCSAPFTVPANCAGKSSRPSSESRNLWAEALQQEVPVVRAGRQGHSGWSESGHRRVEVGLHHAPQEGHLARLLVGGEAPVGHHLDLLLAR
jgi:hypothetical protein